MFKNNVRNFSTLPVLLATILIPLLSNSQALINEFAFGTQYGDRIRGSLVHPEGNVFFVGISHTDGLGDAQMALHKTDGDGNLIWSKFFGDTLQDYGFSIALTHDNQLILCGEAGKPANGYDIFLVKADTAGNMIWQKKFGGNNNMSGLAIKTTSDKGFFIGGFVNDQSGYNDMYGLKLDSLGNFQWDIVAGGADNDYGNSVMELANGDYLLCGDTRSYGNGGYDIYFVRMDSAGNNIWDASYGDQFENGCQGTIKLADGNFLTFGETEISTGSAFDFFYEKISPAGASIWRKVFGDAGAGAEAAFSLIELPNGELVGTGYKNLPGLPLDLVVFKTDPAGNVIWEQMFGNSGIDLGYSLAYHPQKNTFIASGMISGNTEDNYIVVIPDSIINNSVNNVTPNSQMIRVYPNPAVQTGQITIEGITPGSILSVLNLQGKEIWSGISQENFYRLPANRIPSAGLYFLNIKNGSLSTTTKLIISQ